MDELVSRAKEVQQQVWSPGDDITVVDEGPVEIRQMLKPYVLLLFVVCSFISYIVSNRTHISPFSHSLIPLLIFCFILYALLTVWC